MQLQTLSELRISIVTILRTGQVASNSTSEQSITNLTRHIFLFGKYFRRLSQLDGSRFITMPLCAEMVFYYWSKVVQATSSQSACIEGTSHILQADIVEG